MSPRPLRRPAGRARLLLSNPPNLKVVKDPKPRTTAKYDFGGRLVRLQGKGVAKYAPTRGAPLCLLLLNEDIFGKILACLDCQALGSRFAGASLALRRLAELNVVWKVLLYRLILKGVYVPKKFKASILIPLSKPKPGFWRCIFQMCIGDARRNHIEEEELCSFTWSFRFKQSAGRTWLELDPWWQNSGPALQLRFKKDRTVEHIGRSLLGGPTPEFRWRFQSSSGSRHPSLRGRRPLGSFLRMAAPWGEFPTLIVRRAPNWGFILESCWALYTSFPLPKRGDSKELEDETRITGEMQEEDIERYNGDDDEDQEEDEEEEEDEDDEEQDFDQPAPPPTPVSSPVTEPSPFGLPSPGPSERRPRITFI